MQHRDRIGDAGPRARWRISFALAAVALLFAAPASASADLVLVPDPVLLIFLIVFFCALVFVVNQLIFRPVFAVLEEREARVDGARLKAEQVAAEADSLLEAYDASISGARADADRARKERLAAVRVEQSSSTAAARAEAETRVETARNDLAQTLAEARQGLQAASRDLARAAAQRILGREF